MKPKIFNIKKGKYQLKAKIYPDGSGEYEILEKDKFIWEDNKYHQINCQESGDLKTWIIDIKNNIKEQNMIFDFLDYVDYECRVTAHLN